jgi:UDP-N-acetylmuramoyl-tripeptide--D-alanyl-D-alanine ligase
MDIAKIYDLFNSSEGISTDTRKIFKNTLFFALKGENFNGNKFATQAIKQGASYAIIDEEKYNTSEHTILVDNVLSTLQALAHYHRKKLNTPILAITGSNGKTTTKELINAVLSKKFKTTATIGNLNNHIGVPLTLLYITEQTEFGIIEMGANHQQEISFLSNITEPNFGYITNFGKAHLEGFGGIEGVIKGKSELYTCLKKNNQKVFFNTNDTIQKELTQGMNTIPFGNSTQLTQSDPFLKISYKTLEIKTNLIGEYNFSNISAAIAIGEYFNVEASKIKEAIEEYVPTNNRSQIISKKSAQIILDAYNANPTSMNAALNNFKKTATKNKIIILGDMFELGDDSNFEHQEIVNKVELLDFYEIHLIGRHFNKTKASKANLHSTFEAFKNSFIPKNATYLIKGSRGMALERTLELFD